jgi:hypothetical protein
MPASSSNEHVWAEPKDVTLTEFVDNFRRQLSELMGQFGFECIVLDCFCGIDLLTTAGAAVAAHTIIVNEADIVTFTGSINLFNHLERSITELQKKPKIHFVINRLKCNYSVAQLSLLYKNNIEKAVNEAILCHFPYHDRIFDNFGLYPFVSDLIPQSLFVRKLELLTFLLFKDNMDHLIKPKVRQWSKRKIQTIYRRSVDPTAVDADYLVIKLTSFPMLAGIWLITSLILLRTIALSPFQAWGVLLLIVAAATTITTSSLLHGFWLAARLNFTLAKFRYRLTKHVQAIFKKTRSIVGTVSALISGLLMTLTVATLGFYLALAIGMFLDFVFNVGLYDQAEDQFQTRIVEVAANTPVRVLDLSGAEISDFDFSLHKFAKIRPYIPAAPFLAFDRPLLLTNNTKFIKCRFTDILFDDTTWENCLFDNCGFYPKDDIFEGESSYPWERSSALYIRNTNWTGVKFFRVASHRVLFLENSKFKNVEITVENGSGVWLSNCEFSKVILRDSTDGKSSMLTVFDKSSDSELELLGEWKTVTPNEFYPRSSELDEIISSEKKALKYAEAQNEKVNDDYRSHLANLIELYILSNQFIYLENSVGHINDLLILTTAAGDIRLEGIAYMLRLLLNIIYEPKYEEINDALNTWIEWLKTNGAIDLWEWQTWNGYLPRWQFNSNQLRMLDAVQASARGMVKPVELAKIFYQIIKADSLIRQEKLSERGSVSKE